MVKYKDTNTFIIATSKSLVQMIDANDLLVEVRHGHIFSNSFIYDSNNDQWVELINHPHVPELIKKEATESKSTCFKPNFFFCEQVTSPSSVSTPELESKIKEISTQVLTLIDMNENKLDIGLMVELEKIKDCLEETNLIKEDINSIKLKLEQDKGSSSDLISDKLEEIKTELVSGDVAANKISEELSAINSEQHDKFLSLDSKITKLIEVTLNKEPNNVDEGLRQQVEHYKSRYDDLLNTYNEYKATSEKMIKMLQENTSATHAQPVEKQSTEASEKESGITKKVVRPSFGQKKDLSTLEIVKKGRSFNFKNHPIWLVDYGKGDGVQGPFRFDKILQLVTLGEINQNTQIRKKGTNNWSNANDVLELNSEVVLSLEDPINAENNIYTIENCEYRIDVFDEIVNLFVDGEDFKGKLTNISLSGAFIELNRFDGKLSKPNANGVLDIKKGQFNSALSINFIIRRVINGKVKGIGISFEDVNDIGLKVISDYIYQYIDTKHKKTA